MGKLRIIESAISYPNSLILYPPIPTQAADKSWTRRPADAHSSLLQPWFESTRLNNHPRFGKRT
jgi:hypothetical protein